MLEQMPDGQWLDLELLAPTVIRVDARAGMPPDPDHCVTGYKPRVSMLSRAYGAEQTAEHAVYFESYEEAMAWRDNAAERINKVKAERMARSAEPAARPTISLSQIAPF